MELITEIIDRFSFGFNCLLEAFSSLVCNKLFLCIFLFFVSLCVVRSFIRFLLSSRPLSTDSSDDDSSDDIFSDYSEDSGTYLNGKKID